MQGGPDLYNGSLAADLLADIREAGGLLTQQDLQAFRNIHSYTHTWSHTWSKA
jgi:gamma-glutamyltranspeptidase